jgi:hypothetical protein
LLVLFPVGLLNVHWAVQNNRLAQAAANAAAVAEMPHIDRVMQQRFTLRDDPAYTVALQTANYPGPALFNAATGAWNFDQATGFLNAGPPIFVDPIGCNTWPDTTGVANTPTLTNATAPLPGPYGVRYGRGIGLTLGRSSTYAAIPIAGLGTHIGIPRVTTSFAPVSAAGLAAARNWCSLEDDIDFAVNGEPTGRNVAVPPAIPVERGRRYSWAYMCRFPQWNNPNVVEMSVVLFSGRSVNGPVNAAAAATAYRSVSEYTYLGSPQVRTFPEGTSLGLGTTITNLAFIRGQTEVIIRQTAGMPWPPKLRTGDYVLDSTVILPANAANRMPLSNGYFYKVTAVNEPENLGGTPALRFQIEQPARASGFVATIMQGVVAVIEKSNGRMPAH